MNINLSRYHNQRQLQADTQNKSPCHCTNCLGELQTYKVSRGHYLNDKRAAEATPMFMGI